MMLGLLLARGGLDVRVLEKHADFLRDFRGDTVHPSTLNVLDTIGLGDRVAELPGRRVTRLAVTFDDGEYPVADFGRLRTAHPYLYFVPQWDLLEMLAKAGAEHPTFTLLRSYGVTGLLTENGVVRGVRATGPDGPTEIRARLTVGADGRGSTVRTALGLPMRRFGAPMDVLWFRLSRRAEDGAGLAGRIGAGRMLIRIDRGEYWQTAYVITKGGYEAVRAAGLDKLRASIAALVPALADRVGEITGWDDVRLLSVQVDRARRWHAPGALLIGDAAHAMSPIGGVGINLAVQDAVAAARMLTAPLLAARRHDQAGGSAQPLPTEVLAAVQRRRRFPTVVIQLAQRAAQRGLLRPVLASEEPVNAPLPLRLLSRSATGRSALAYAVGIGPCPERP